MSTQNTWKKDFANEADKAINHPITQECMDELLFNLGSNRKGMPYYGLLKLSNIVAQIARAQALGIDPETLRMSEEEAYDELSERLELFADSGQPVIIVEPGVPE